jgi:MoaA/NifB/PqqE/SkfB family radical SAM enzyme
MSTTQENIISKEECTCLVEPIQTDPAPDNGEHRINTKELVSLKLGVLYLYITGKCNFRCAHCFSSKLEKEHIETRRLMRLLENVRRIPQITISGGEPTLHPNFLIIIRKAAKVANCVYIDTNASWVSLDLSAAIVQVSKIPKNCIFCVSLDKYHFDSVEEKGVLERRIKNLILAARANGIRCTLYCASEDNTLPTLSDLELTEIIEEKRGLGDLLVRGIMPFGSAITNHLRTLDTFAGYSEQCQCLAEKASVGIDNRGRVFSSWKGLTDQEISSPCYLGTVDKKTTRHTFWRLIVRKSKLRALKLAKKKCL